MKNKTIFLTGATGFLGSYLLKELIKSDNNIYVLARGSKGITASQRIFDSLIFWDKNISSKDIRKIRIVEGDIAFDDLGVNNKEIMREILSSVEIVIHSAALPDLRKPLDLIRKINVDGTKNMLELALKLKNLKKYCQISTAYVVGNKSVAKFDESMLDIGQGFNNTYEQTKYEAELLCKEYSMRGINITIIRPSMIIGDSKSGKTKEFHLFYEPLHFFSKNIYDVFPAGMECNINLINVDTVCEAICVLLSDEEQNTYHIVSPNEFKIGEVLRSASKYFGIIMPKFVPKNKFDLSKWTATQRHLSEPFLPYLNFASGFSLKLTQNKLRHLDYSLPLVNENSLHTAFNYCSKRGYIKRATN